MVSIKVLKSNLFGFAQAPASKSETHRALVISALTDGVSQVLNPLVCDDTRATLKAIRKLGIKINESEHSFTVKGGTLNPSSVPIHCDASGTTLRFITALCSLLKGTSVLTGTDSLIKRPHQPLLVALNEFGAEVNAKGQNIIVKSQGFISGASLILPDNISSQFVSALLIIAPKAFGNITITIPKGKGKHSP